MIPEIYPVTRAMQHYAEGIAYATLKQFDAANGERSAFSRAMARIPRSDNSLTIQRMTSWLWPKMLDGEMEYHKGNYERLSLACVKAFAVMTV